MGQAKFNLIINDTISYMVKLNSSEVDIILIKYFNQY